MMAGTNRKFDLNKIQKAIGVDHGKTPHAKLISLKDIEGWNIMLWSDESTEDSNTFIEMFKLFVDAYALDDDDHLSE